MKLKLTFAQYMLRTKNSLLRAIFEKMLEEARPKTWIRQFREYMGELGVWLLQVRKMRVILTETGAACFKKF